MKKILFAVLAATTLFASCAKEGNNNPEVVTGSPAKLTISFNNPAKSRALDTTTDETEIKNATAFVLSSTGEILSTITVDVDDSAKEYAVTTAANKVLVIANANLSSITATTLTALKKEVATLEALDGATDGFFASGTSDVLAFTGTASDLDESPLAAAVVEMTLLPAKLNVKVVNGMENYGEEGSLELNDVAVLYSAGFSHWVAATENGNDFYPTTATISAISGAKYFRSGFSGWDSDDSNQDVVLADLLKTWTAPDDSDFEETFYVYPIANGAYSRNTILVVRATIDDEPRYFPVHFSLSDAGALVSGHEYDVTITLSGDAASGGGGTGDPEEEVIPAFVSVTISINQWTATSPIYKTFE